MSKLIFNFCNGNVDADVIVVDICDATAWFDVDVMIDGLNKM
jgi:hypothetical protein